MPAGSCTAVPGAVGGAAAGDTARPGREKSGLITAAISPLHFFIFWLPSAEYT